MGADCKSVAKATQVRILYLPPHGQALFGPAATPLSAGVARNSCAGGVENVRKWVEVIGWQMAGAVDG